MSKNPQQTWYGLLASCWRLPGRCFIRTSCRRYKQGCHVGRHWQNTVCRDKSNKAYNYFLAENSKFSLFISPTSLQKAFILFILFLSGSISFYISSSPSLSLSAQIRTASCCGATCNTYRGSANLCFSAATYSPPAICMKVELRSCCSAAQEEEKQTVRNLVATACTNSRGVNDISGFLVPYHLVGHLWLQPSAALATTWQLILSGWP